MLNLLDSLIERRLRRGSTGTPEQGGLRPAVVVTGGSRGLGLAIAARFAATGQAVLLVARGKPGLEAAARSIVGGGPVLILSLDVTQRDSAQRIEAHLSAQGYFADVLVNSAGMGLAGGFTGHEPARLAELVALNLTAPAVLMRHFLPPMSARRRGGVINVASLGGYVPGPHQALYYASKAALISLSEAVAVETCGSGVRVVALAPGPSPTDFHARMGAEGALYRRLLPGMAPETIARSAWRGFYCGRRVIVPGTFYTGLAWLLRMLPHAVTVPIVARLLSPPRG